MNPYFLIENVSKDKLWETINFDYHELALTPLKNDSVTYRILKTMITDIEGYLVLKPIGFKEPDKFLLAVYDNWSD